MVVALNLIIERLIWLGIYSLKFTAETIAKYFIRDDVYRKNIAYQFSEFAHGDLFETELKNNYQITSIICSLPPSRACPSVASHCVGEVGLLSL